MRFSSYALGATLYMPILHPKIGDILHGRVPAPSTSIVLCLEDALADADVGRGLENLGSLMGNLPDVLSLQVFLRPRNRSMAARLCDIAGGTSITGIVAPKVMPDTLPEWISLCKSSGLKIMPTLESASFFDPGKICAVRDVLDGMDLGVDTLSAIRLGGNDFLSALALRRERGITSWEGPLGWVLSMASSILVSSGYPVAAPVYDIIDDIETLRREVIRDVAAGFISKTVIHPAQVPIVSEAFRVSEDDLHRARAILEGGAGAVFQIGGVMCEPATHKSWAERILARAEIFGPQSSEECVKIAQSEALSR